MKPLNLRAHEVRQLLATGRVLVVRVVKPQPVMPPADCHPMNQQKHPQPYLDSYCSESKTLANPRGMSASWVWWQVDDRPGLPVYRCPFGQPGSKCWGRETFRELGSAMMHDGKLSRSLAQGNLIFLADGHEYDGPWRSSTTMPHWASRFHDLTIESVSVKRVQDVTEEEARAAGMTKDDDPYWAPSYNDPDSGGNPSYRRSFDYYWEQSNGYGAWDSNDWCWFAVVRNG